MSTMSNAQLKYHYHPAKGWINDPNGLVWFKGYYHVFYQHSPNSEVPGTESMVWGHARTKDFLTYEELPIAIPAERPYDIGGAWSGTATVKDGTLYAYYASITSEGRQVICVATSGDGINFTKYEGNPIISEYPMECGGNFRDPAVFSENGIYYLVIASADTANSKGTLLLYRSDDMFSWEYSGVFMSYDDCMFCECPSFLKLGDGYLLANSVCPNDGHHYFEVLYGDFDGKKFTPSIVSHFQKGPDEYAGQVFSAPDGRAILISWVSGWNYRPEKKCIGCMSIPLEISLKGDKLAAFPVEEVRSLLDGNTITDAYVRETYVNGGEEVYIELTEKPE